MHQMLNVQSNMAPIEAQMPDLRRIEAEIQQIGDGIQQWIITLAKIANEIFGPLPPTQVDPGIQSQGNHAIERIDDQIRRLAALRDDLSAVGDRFTRLV